MKVYCEDMIMDLFYNQTKNKQIEILTNALSLMSMCNAQTEVEVIAKSMGFEKSYEGGGYIKIKLKNLIK